MKKGLLFLLITALLVLTCVFTACGDDKKDAKSETESKNATEVTSASDETTVVLETTSEGGTVEKDPDGNKITRDKNGEIVAVEDKNGITIEITEYITTHQWITESGPSGSSSQKKSDSTSSSESKEEVTEGEIPVVIASVEDDSDEVINLD